MSAFSRGCFLKHQCAIRPRLFRPPRYQSRLFTTTPPRAAKSSKHVTSKSKPAYTPPSTTSNSPAPSRVYKSYADTLAQKMHPTPLYEAPSHTMFMVTSYTGAGLFLLYGGYAVFTSYDVAPEVAWWVPRMFQVGACCMGLMAGYFVLGPASLVKSITALPKNVVLTLGTAAKGATVPELQLEVELRKMFPVPFFPARKIYVKPQDIVLPMSLSPPIRSSTSEHLSASERRIMRLEAEAEKERELEYERNHLLTAPFIHASKAFFSLFENTKRALMRDGFANINVKGRKYKLDVTGGWALDNGRALDRLVRVIDV